MDELQCQYTKADQQFLNKSSSLRIHSVGLGRKSFPGALGEIVKDRLIAYFRTAC